nr:PepSY-associated TM helix domain-containing protein [uncultured Carboxylicivirga sp.]
MKWSSKLRKWIRIIHRDLGYLLVGITIIYGISGFLLNHMNGKDPAYHTMNATIQIEPHLSTTDITEQLSKNDELPKVKTVLTAKDGFYKVLFNGGIGAYNTNTGELSYEIHQKRPFVYAINKLHYNKVKGWTATSDFFAFSLIFLAISGMFMVKGKNGLIRRGISLILIGLAIPILYVVFA